MQTASRDLAQTKIALSQIPLAKATGWGLLGGLIATLIMDLVLMGVLLAAGLPALSCFTLVGDTLASLISLNEIANTGNIPLGIAAHYLIGPLLGGLFGTFAARINALRAGSLKKVVVWAVLYAEILSQPMLAMTPILLQLTASDTLQWYGGSVVMHLIWGCVLGVVWSRGVPSFLPRIPRGGNWKEG